VNLCAPGYMYPNQLNIERYLQYMLRKIVVI
jgi:hypothetical protein